MCCPSTTSGCSARWPTTTTAASAWTAPRCLRSRSPGDPGARSQPGICGAASTRSRSSIERRALSPPFAGLTPDVVLDALDSVGLHGDGRMLALNSYENRVYQVAMAEGPPYVAKFYRPGRWTDAQIREEHGFVHELAGEEIPAVEPLALP